MIGLFLQTELIPNLLSNKPFSIYSGHEETIAPFIALISNNYDCLEPNLASIVEIRTITKDNIEMIEVDYNGK